MRPGRIAVLGALLCSSCTVGPRYQRPVAQTPPALKAMAGNDQWKMATPSDGLLKGNWWEIFGDPQLNRLEELVSINNQNVKQAEAQFRQARALVLANHANYYPSIGSNPSITQSDTGLNGGRGGTSQTFSLGATATWEPDLWGRVRLSVENAVNNAQVSAADLENIRLSQQALLATDYFSLAAEDMQLAHIAGHDRRLSEESAVDVRPFPFRTGRQKRCCPGGNPACGRKSPGHGNARHAGAVRARHRRADRSAAILVGHRRQQDQRPASADSGGRSLTTPRAASRHRGQ